MRIFTPNTWYAFFAVCTLRGELLLVDLFDDAVENLFADRVHSDFGWPTCTREISFRNVDTHINLLVQKCGDRSIRRNQIARPNIKNLHGGFARREHFAFPESRFIVGIGSLRGLHIFAAIAAL